MKHSYTLEASLYTPATLPADLRLQYGHLRYQCFEEDDPNLNMDRINKVEFDHFDHAPDTRYILVTQKHPDFSPPTLVSAVRLIPTTGHYELEMDSYRYLTQGVALPKSPLIWEGNRWVGKSSHTALGKLSTGLLLLKLFQLSQQFGFNQLIGTITTKGEAWLGKRNASLQRNSDIYTVERENIDILISLIDINADLLRTAKTLLMDSIDTFAIANIALETREAA
ncbi:MAG: hypothetical protein KDI30_00670 [Pseudomonadales bacterium]|nr:hypothetical protein [Pseudomonadales bacterium]